MRGIILAGGTGSRLDPLTRSINKHLLPVGQFPMIYHPLRVLRDNGITDITVVSSPSGVGQLAALLGGGREHGCRLTYCVQDEPGGIAQALLAARRYEDLRDIAVILGDNIFLPSPGLNIVREARCFLYRIESKSALQSLGVAQFDQDSGFIRRIIEKPLAPPSPFAVTGLYVFPSSVWPKLIALEAGERGEYEITDLLNAYAYIDELEHTIVEGFWGDAGTFDGLKECSAAVG